MVDCGREWTEDLEGVCVHSPEDRAERIRSGRGTKDPPQLPAWPHTHLARASRARTSPTVSSGRIISRKACSPFSDLMRSMESGGAGDSGDSRFLRAQRPSVPPQPNPRFSPFHSALTSHAQQPRQASPPQSPGSGQAMGSSSGKHPWRVDRALNPARVTPHPHP